MREVKDYIREGESKDIVTNNCFSIKYRKGIHPILDAFFLKYRPSYYDNGCTCVWFMRIDDTNAYVTVLIDRSMSGDSIFLQDGPTRITGGGIHCIIEKGTTTQAIIPIILCEGIVELTQVEVASFMLEGICKV